MGVVPITDISVCRVLHWGVTENESVPLNLPTNEPALYISYRT